MKMETSPSTEKPPSNSTSDVSKPAANGNDKSKSAAKKSAKRKAAPKKKQPAKKQATKRKTAAKSPKRKPAAKVKGGRPMMFPDKTIIRMPPGYLKAINAKARAKDLGQGDFLRGVIGRAIGK